MLIKGLLRSAFISSAFFFTACTTLTAPPICDSFDGIKDSLDREQTVSVLMVHGMSGYSDGDPKSLICNIANYLCLCPDGEPLDRHISADNPHKWYGCLLRQDYCSTRCPYRVRFYTLDWRPSTWNEKSLVRSLDECCESSCRRVKLTDEFKVNFVNNGMGDVIMYLGEYANEIRYPFEQAIRWIDQDNRHDGCHEIVVVTFSMGGQVLLDTLEHMRGSADPVSHEARQQFVDDVAAFFMLSNQLPLTELALLKPPRTHYPFHDDATDHCADCCPTTPLCEPECPQTIDWPSTAVGHFIADKRQTLPCFRIVSFSDPNDILTYMFQCCAPEELACDYFINAGVLNVKRAWFGLLNPATAHQDYGRNCDVIRMITYGFCP